MYLSVPNMFSWAVTGPPGASLVYTTKEDGQVACAGIKPETMLLLCTCEPIAKHTVRSKLWCSRSPIGRSFQIFVSAKTNRFFVYENQCLP